MSVALIIQHEKCMPSVVLSSVPCTAGQEFSALSHKLYYFRENVTEHKICALIFFTLLSEMFLDLRKIQRDIITNIHKSSRKMKVIRDRFQ